MSNMAWYTVQHLVFNKMSNCVSLALRYFELKFGLTVVKILWVFLILHCFSVFFFFQFFIVFPVVLACATDGNKLLLKYKLSAKQPWPETVVLGAHLCMRIWIRARIGLSKKPLAPFIWGKIRRVLCKMCPK